MEPLPAVLARIRSRVRVDEQVRGQCGGALEAFAADFTAEAPLLQNKLSFNVEDLKLLELNTQIQ